MILRTVKKVSIDVYILVKLVLFLVFFSCESKGLLGTFSEYAIDED